MTQRRRENGKRIGRRGEGGEMGAGLYKEYFPPPWGRGIKSKGLEMGKKIKSWKRRKKKIFEDLPLLVVPNSSI